LETALGVAFAAGFTGAALGATSGGLAGADVPGAGGGTRAAVCTEAGASGWGAGPRPFSTTVGSEIAAGSEDAGSPPSILARTAAPMPSTDRAVTPAIT
jgi:hypothetical protein